MLHPGEASAVIYQFLNMTLLWLCSPQVLSSTHCLNHKGLHNISCLCAVVQSVAAVAAHVGVISSQVAVLQLDNTRRDMVTAAIQTETHTMHLLLQSLCSAMGMQQQCQPQPQPSPLSPSLQHAHTPTLWSQQQQVQAQVPVMNHSQTASSISHSSPQDVHSTAQLPQLEGLQGPLLQLQQLHHQPQQLQRPITSQSPQPPPGFQPPPTVSYVAVAQTPISHAVATALSVASVNSNSGAVIPRSIPSSTTPNPILYMDAQSLEELFSEINSSAVPTTFDLGGRTLYHQVSDQPAVDIIITASNVTVRNGKLHHSDLNDRLAPGLHVQGSNVGLESITLQGGNWGVLVMPGGSAKLSKCSVLESNFGLGVGNFGFIGTAGTARLEAIDVVVVGCAGRGLSVGKGGQARLQGSDFKNCFHHGIFVGGDSSSRLTATNVRCNGNKKRGLCVIAQGKAMLSKCNMLGNTGGSLFVQEAQSVIKHSQCALDSFLEALQGGNIREVSSL